MAIFSAINHPRGTIVWWLVLALSILAIGIYVGVDWAISEKPEAMTQATFVGRSSCIDCHQAEYDAYAGSHHDRAMELATEETVLGDFGDVTFERLGETTRFFRRDGKFFVHAEGPEGKYHDYQVQYTFGFDPLQQYMVEFPDGRVQVLRVSWDTHRKEWFYVPPPDAVDLRLAHDDPTHWTGIAQNWNTTCAECHSTNLQKNYDLATDTYHTTFSEIDVSCESCHGPGSLHVKLAKSGSLFWDRRHGYGLAKLQGLDSTPQIETCAQCHSRRGAVHAEFRPGQRFADHYNVSLLRDQLYHADGQMADEVYVYGSFLQSRMHAMGVRCTDCHNPHSLDLKFEGNQLCAQCHIPAKYDTVAHHHHQANTPGAACVTCHMPETTYMVVDRRRDHHIRSPRPDQTVAFGTPNACNDCHTKPEESAEWAAAKIVEWYGPDRPAEIHGPHRTAAFDAAWKGKPEGEKLLIDLIGRPKTPSITKASAIALLGQYGSPDVAGMLRAALDDPSPSVRQSAVQSLPADSPQELLRLVAPLLRDRVRTVRIAAAVRLLPLDPKQLTPNQAETLALATDEYREQLAMASDHAESHRQLALLARRDHDASKGVEELRLAIGLAPYLTNMRAELALLLTEIGGHDEEVEQLRREETKLLLRDIQMLPDNPAPRYRLGLLYYLLEDLENAETWLAQACEMRPQSYPFALGLALLQQERYKRGEDSALERAVESIKKLDALHPQSPDAKNLLRELIQLQKIRDEAESE